jgi:hypothetical protein
MHRQKYQKKYIAKNPEHKRQKNLRYRLRKWQQGVIKEDFVEIVSNFLDLKCKNG